MLNTMKDLRKDNKINNSPVGKESQAKLSGYYCDRKSPAGDFYSKLKGYSHRMKYNPTPKEKLLYDLLDKNKIPYHSQKVILPYIVDCFVPTKKLIIELDGKHHIEDLNQFTYDTTRDTLLMSLGIIVARWDNDKFNSTNILDTIQKRPTYNPQKILVIIGKHNKRYAEKGFNKFSIKYFNDIFRKTLIKELKFFNFSKKGINL